MRIAVEYPRDVGWNDLPRVIVADFMPRMGDPVTVEHIDGTVTDLWVESSRFVLPCRANTPMPSLEGLIRLSARSSSS